MLNPGVVAWTCFVSSERIVHLGKDRELESQVVSGQLGDMSFRVKDLAHSLQLLPKLPLAHFLSYLATRFDFFTFLEKFHSNNRDAVLNSF